MFIYFLLEMFCQEIVKVRTKRQFPPSIVDVEEVHFGKEAEN